MIISIVVPNGAHRECRHASCSLTHPSRFHFSLQNATIITRAVLYGVGWMKYTTTMARFTMALPAYDSHLTWRCSARTPSSSRGHYDPAFASIIFSSLINGAEIWLRVPLIFTARDVRLYSTAMRHEAMDETAKCHSRVSPDATPSAPKPIIS